MFSGYEIIFATEFSVLKRLGTGVINSREDLEYFFSNKV